MQAEAERRKRAEILQSEGDRQSEVNIAQGKRQSAILFAEGEAQAILRKAEASAEGIRKLSSAISNSPGGQQAASLRVAEQWVASWKEIARSSNTVVVPANAGDASSMISTAMSIFRQVNREVPVTSMDRDEFGGLPPADGRAAEFGSEAPRLEDDADTTSAASTPQGHGQ